VTVEQGADHVDVRVVRRELVTLGSPADYSEWEPVESSIVRASFVIGADGYDSRVRGALGIEPVNVGGMEAFAIFESSSVEEGEAALHLCYDDASSSVMLPLPGGRVRWCFQVRAGLDAQPDGGRLRALISERAGWYASSVGDVVWGTTMHFERRLARRFGRNRVWLAGDAAHVTSPLGGQSMNAGLIEAYELAGAMARAIHTGNVHDNLAAYESERTREWHKLLGVNVRFDLLPHAPEWLTTHARRLVPTLPATGADLTRSLEHIGLRLR
jgi:2-polyprenyl-6-methoxyphenol hydroxylase-like FAD-dependent oxidoreductase